MMTMLSTLLLIALLFGQRTYQQGAKITMSSPIPNVVVSSTFNESDASRRVISLLSTANMGGVVLTMGPLCAVGTKFALDTIKKIPNLLPSYDLKIELIDDACSRPTLVSKLVGELRRSDSAVGRFPFSPGTYCTGQIYSGQIVNHFDFVGLTSHSGTSEIYKFRKRYGSYFVDSWSPSMIYEGLAEFLYEMGWLRYAILSESSDFFIELENVLVSRMEKKNGTKLAGLFRYPYISGVLPDSAQIETAVNDLSKINPRIIIVDAVQGSRAFCWLYRYKLYGPNYVLFVYGPTSFAPNDPTRFTDWCTEDMLREVLQSAFFIGTTSVQNLENFTAVDSFGVSGAQYEDYLKSVIEKPEVSPSWFFWRTHCYDTLESAALILNTTETILNKRNQTLSDWTTDKTLFQQNSAEIKQILKEAAYATPHRTFQGDVEFDPATTLNSLGRIWLGFFQVRKKYENSTFLYPFPVGVYDPKEEGRIIFGPATFSWRTIGGRIPPDGIRILNAETPLIPESAYVTLTAISALELTVTILVAFHNVWFRKTKTCVKNSVPLINGFILLGDVVLQGFILVQPMYSFPSINQNCMTAHGCLFIGIACLIYGIEAKLELAGSVFEWKSTRSRMILPRHPAVADCNIRMRTINQSNMSVIPSTAAMANGGYGYRRESLSGQVMAHQPLSSQTSAPRRRSSLVQSTLHQPILRVLSQARVKWMFLIGIYIIVLVTVLIVVWFKVAPMDTERIEGPFQYSETDISLAFQFHHYECLVWNDASITGTVIIGILSAACVALALRAIYLGYAMRSAGVLVIADWKIIASCLYGTVIFLACVAIIAAAIFQGNQQYQRIALSAGIFGTVALNLAFIFIPPVFSKNEPHDLYIAY